MQVLKDKKKFLKILIFNCICGIISVILILKNHNEYRLLKWAIIVVLGLLYNSFFLEKFIRKIPLLKVFYVGLTWALINSWLILPHFNLAIFFITWLFISALVLPFDIRDMNNDDVVTFPILIGVEKTKILAYLLIFISGLLSVFYLNLEFGIYFFLTIIITFILIYFSENDNREAYFSFLVESCSGFPLLCLLAYKLLLQFR
jgi:4-hydroxybenzoate polyprenyltransferase